MVFIGLMTGCFDNVNYNVIILNEDKVRDFTSFGRYFPQVFNPNRSFRLNPSLASRSKHPDMAATIKTQGQPTCYVRVALCMNREMVSCYSAYFSVICWMDHLWYTKTCPCQSIHRLVELFSSNPRIQTGLAFTAEASSPSRMLPAFSSYWNDWL